MLRYLVHILDVSRNLRWRERKRKLGPFCVVLSGLSPFDHLCHMPVSRPRIGAEGGGGGVLAAEAQRLFDYSEIPALSLGGRSKGKPIVSPGLSFSTTQLGSADSCQAQAPDRDEGDRLGDRPLCFARRTYIHTWRTAAEFWMPSVSHRRQSSKGS
ncbi:uncharacterized protein LY79DRAFT_404811 [Colletotrichum navitas]|uniref:Uncharacterized protein n=1 Tax=Colletotrichum navitas TaxID=681940 RepID=A0AAD8Q8S6_9PEZI|nr:uncharacterized protein LY79DRAFT_404811 [Colletotrichum navitas]KAK1597087.1 hypothetical protein LY79DRAFT_404811 [Colletotrichum navitas]